MRKPQQTVRAPRKPAPGRARRVVHGLLLLAAAAIIADTLVGDRGLLAMMQARREYSELATSLAQAKLENARLREEARRLRDDPKAIEEIARRDLGFIRPGEKVFIIRDVAPSSRAGS